MPKKPFTLLTICRGLPASGKTSWAKEQVRRNYGSTVRVNRDDLRMDYFGSHVLTGPDCNRNEDLLTKIQLDTIQCFLMAKKQVIVDDSNLAQRAIDNLYNLAARFHGAVQIRFQDFEITLKESITRNAARESRGERFVGEREIREISDRHLFGGHELPSLDSKFYEFIGEPMERTQDASLPSAWLFDLDGTLARVETDREYFDWQRVDEDAPIERAVKLLLDLKAAGHRIILVTGRDAVCRPETIEWLEAWEIPYDELLMRQMDDGRADEIVKAEIFERHINNHYFVAGVLDDRNKVSDMWRSMGLFTAQVNPGLF